MSNVKIKYILDANVFIEAYRRYYAFDIAPTFWKFLINSARNNFLISIDRVYNELTRSDDQLAKWIKNKFSFAFIKTNTDSDIITNYASLMKWAYSQEQFLQTAKDDFARDDNADAWIVATASSYNFTVVTHEVLDTKIKKKIPIPNVCREFNVKYINTFDLLRKFNFKFN